MARTIPLIRAAALFPLIRWMNLHGRAPSDWVARVGLEQLDEGARERPIPLVKGFELFRMLAAQEGPSACARTVSPYSLQDLGVYGALILGARTPRKALMRAVHFLPRYSTHEMVALRPISGGLRLQAGWCLALDEEMMHLTQQFTAALVVGLCHATQQPSAYPRSISIRSHPEAGIDHLREFFGDTLTASNEAVLSVDLDDRVLDSPLQWSASECSKLPPPNWTMPQGEGSFSASVFLALDALRTGLPIRVDDVAALAGMSKRSFQRMLSNEGASFRSILDAAHRARTLETLSGDHGPATPAAIDLGFSGKSSLGRAVRRWTGVSPKQFRIIN